MMHRYSSRRSPLKDFLATQLQGACRYDRIAGFFSSSLLEVAGEALERMTPKGGETCIRVVCNSCLDPLDVQTARAAKWGMHREWCAFLPAEIGAPMKARLQRLHDFLSSGFLKVKVLPDEVFGLIHGKAGVITRTDGSRVCFIGSANESRTAWVSNYELVWLDESEEGVRWVQEEFDALWSSSQAVDLAEAVIQDVVRLIHRFVIPDIAAWKEAEAEPAGPIVELPIYRRENGLWAHQKGRIQRIGQLRPEVMIYNMRYKDSVEDRVHQLLSERLENIRNMFGQIPDTLEDVWVAAALRDEEEAKLVIDAVPKRHPFEMRYDRIENVDWESCSRVLDSTSQLEALQKGW